MTGEKPLATFSYDIVRTHSEWRALETGWNSLVERSRARSLFLTWQWLDTWMSVHDVGSSLFAVCVRAADGQLVGAAPLYANPYLLLRTTPFRVLRPIGDVDSGAEYQTWPVDAAHEVEVQRTIVDALRECPREWDLVWMPKLDWWSPYNVELSRTLKREGFLVNRRTSPFSAVSLPGGFDQYLNGMSANRRQQVRRAMRKILSKSGVEVRRVQDPAEIPQALDTLFRLHNSRWEAVGHEGLFQRNPSERTFYERFVPIALEQGWLAMHILTDQGEAKAVQLGYVYEGVLLQLQEGFDPDYTPHVGNALRAHVINDCIARGFREYDFLGGWSEHKRRWLARERSGADLLIAANRIKTLPVMMARVWPTGSFLRPTGPFVRP